MMGFSRTLKDIRLRLGHEKARGFHQELHAKGVECNYAYYMKMEAAQVIPSAKIVEQISQTLNEDMAKELIFSYCRSLLPSFAHLFPSGEHHRPEAAPEAPPSAPGRELTRRQVSTLGRSKTHYHLFLMTTVARRPLQLEEIKAIFPNHKSLQEALSDLENTQIIRTTRDGISSIASEHRFPSDKEFPELRPIYRLFDEWDERFAEDMNFTEHMNKMMVRRISPRYLGVIEDSLNTVIKFIRAADELDSKYNDSLVQVRLTLKSGKLPG